MGRKDTLLFKILSAHSLSSSFNSPATMIRYADNVSYQINITTTDSIGTFQVQVSNDYAVNESGVITNPGTWDPLTLSGSPVAGAANDVIVISLNQLPYIAIRLAYTAGTPGTGVIDAFITSKQVGG